MSADPGGAATVLCRIGTCLVAFPIEHVAETMRPLPIETHADHLPFLLGVTLIRGAPTPVLNGAALLGTGAASTGRFVLLRLGDRQVAIAVDEVIGVERSPRTATERMPPLVAEMNADVVSSIGGRDGALLMFLETAQLISRGGV